MRRAIMIVVLARALAAGAALAQPLSDASSAEPSLDFDLLDPDDARTDAPTAAFDPAAAERESSAQTRRTMLLWHQGLGFATWGALLGTEIAGQIAFNDAFGKPRPEEIPFWSGVHVIGVVSTVVLFGTTGAMAMLAPAPYRKPPRWDSATVHKICLGLATLGMLVEIPLGGADLRTHQIVGYTTLGLMTVGTAALFF